MIWHTVTDEDFRSRSSVGEPDGDLLIILGGFVWGLLMSSLFIKLFHATARRALLLPDWASRRQAATDYIAITSAAVDRRDGGGSATPTASTGVHRRRYRLPGKLG